MASVHEIIFDLQHEKHVNKALEIYSHLKDDLYTVSSGVNNCSTHIRIQGPWFGDRFAFYLDLLSKYCRLNYNANIMTLEGVMTVTDEVHDFLGEDEKGRAVPVCELVEFITQYVDTHPQCYIRSTIQLNLVLDTGVRWMHHSGFALNSGMYWNFEDALPDNQPVWILAEEDTCDPTQIPSIFRVIHDSNGEAGCRTRLLDFDPERQEEYLSGNNWDIIAWRPMTVHGGSFDQYYKDHGVTERSNWTLTLDAEEEEKGESI